LLHSVAQRASAALRRFAIRWATIMDTAAIPRVIKLGIVANTEISTHKAISAYLWPVILAPPNRCANAKTKMMLLMAASIYPALIPGLSILGYKINKNGMT